MGDCFVGERQVRNSGQEHVRVNNVGSQCLSRLLPVAFPPGCTFRKDEVVHLETPGDNHSLRTRSTGHVTLDQPLPPTRRAFAVSGPTPWA